MHRPKLITFAGAAFVTATFLAATSPAQSPPPRDTTRAARPAVLDTLRRVRPDTTAVTRPPADTTAARFIAGPAGRLRVDDGGQGGIPVVFVHAFAGSGAHWAEQLAHLRRTRRAIAFDVRGHGRSEAPRDTTAWAVDSLAADIGAVADGLGLGRFVLVGHSMGGAAAAAYAGRNPGRVAGLVLAGAPGRMAAAERTRLMRDMRADYAATSEPYWTRLLNNARPSVQTQVRSDMQRMPQGSSLALMSALFAWDPTGAMNAYQGPKLLIENSPTSTPGALRQLAPAVPVKVIPGTSHWVQMDKPEEFNRVLDEFLATVK